jgi:Protein O-mannosyl-transferase TMEM260-like
MAKKHQSHPGNTGYDKTAWLSAGVLFIITLTLYALTACRTIHSGDSAELSLAAACFGVPHPPSYPLYTLLTGLWVHLFPSQLMAFASNLASGLHGAGAAALLLLLLRRWGTSLTAAWFAGLTLAVGRTFWSQSVAAEVYALDLLLLGLFLYLLENGTRRLRGITLVVIGIGLGIWLGHRFINLVYLPAIGLIAWAGFERYGPQRPFSLLKSALLLISGIAISVVPFIYTLIASSTNPPLDIGDADNLPNLITVLQGAPYLRHLNGSMFLATSRLTSFLASLHLESGIAILLALVGLGSLWRAARWRRKLGLGLLLLLVTCLVFACRYNVMDVAVFFLPVTWCLIVLAAFGVTALQQRLPRWSLILLIALSVGSGLAFNLQANNLAGEKTTHQYGRDLLISAPENGVLITQGDTSAHAVWYLQAVEKLRPDVLFISLGHLTPWYFQQLQRQAPEIDWPSPDLLARPDLLFPALLEALGGARTISFAIDPGLMAQYGPDLWWRSRAVIPDRMVITAFKRDSSLNREAIVTRNSEFWSAYNRHGSPVRHEADLETKMVHLQYGLAMLRCGEFAATREYLAAAGELFDQLLKMDTTALEADVTRAYAGIGQNVGATGLRSRAQAGLNSLK